MFAKTRRYRISTRGIFLLVAILSLASGFARRPPSVRLFDGRTFRGWQGDTARTWRIENNALVGGSLTQTVPHNEFLRTSRTYANFVLSLKFKLTGTGFVNAGVQFRSRRLSNPDYEMAGYQADLGDGYWASLYDESRRDRTLARPDSLLIRKILKPNAWNSYEIRCEGRRITIGLNGHTTVDYTEPDAAIEQAGLIALQIHGGGKAEASYKDIAIRELP